MNDEYGDEVFCSDLDQVEPTIIEDIAPQSSNSNPNTLVSTGDRISLPMTKTRRTNYGHQMAHKLPLALAIQIKY